MSACPHKRHDSLRWLADSWCWGTLTDIVRSLTDGPLSTLQVVYGDTASEEFW